MIRPWIILLTFAALLPAAESAQAGQPHYLIDNFTAALVSAQSLSAAVDSETPKVGLGAWKVAYDLSGGERKTDIRPPVDRWRIPTDGKLVFWLKSDGSNNELQFILAAGKFRLLPDGRREPFDVRNNDLPRIKLDSTEWKEISIDLKGRIPEGNSAWLMLARVHAGQPKEKGGPKPAAEGFYFLDDMRVYPAGAAPAAAVLTALVGGAVRDFTSDFSVSLDARNFTGNSGKVKVRLSMTDRNQNAVADRDFDLTIEAGQEKEYKLDLAPENIGIYLPPFHITGDVMSTDLPDLAARVDVDVVMANSRILFDNFSNLNAQWLTRGYRNLPDPDRLIANDQGRWNSWNMGEAARAVPWTQTTAKLTRVRMEKPADAAKAFPPGEFAMQFDYTGEAAAFTGFDRYFPGNAFQFGIWVKGDGSNNRLIANFLDFSDLSDFWEGGWKREREGHRLICRLDFTDWRYFTVPLPGNGIGTNTLRGSTEANDFPIELTSLAVVPEPVADKPDPSKPPSVQSGSVLIGPMFVDTQQTVATTLAAMIAYDDPAQVFAPQHGASIAVQNGWRTGSRKVEAIWTLFDKDNQPIISGKQVVEVPAGEVRSFRIDLAADAARIAPRVGPLRLQVVASDQADLATSVTKEIALAKPDAIVPFADFETARGYLGSKFEDVSNRPAPGEAAAFTSAAQHHSGGRSLEITWDKQANVTRFVAVDPPIPGISIDMTLWVKGDGSGALFYPLIGGPKGVRAGLDSRVWNVFIPRVEGGDLQDAVRLDFTDWRQFTFHFAPVPTNFDKPMPLLHFLPSYPQGLHFGIDARKANGESGAVYVDDVVIRTHLAPENCLNLALQRDTESNVLQPDAPLTFNAFNYDASSPHAAKVTGGVYDWRGDRVAAIDESFELKPAEKREIVLKQKLPHGAYELRVQMKEGDRIVASVAQDLLMADLAPVLGADWPGLMKDEWKLRLPLKDTFTYLDEDWDWIEYYPGNVQTATMRNRFSAVQANGADPWMLLGFSALWSSGAGFEQMKAGTFARVNRHVGQGVDIFLVPQRDEDWETYVIEVMRGVGKDISGWVLWDNPDGASSLALPPKRLGAFAGIADKWRRIYCPKTPLIIGGMARATAVPYLEQLAKEPAFTAIDGVNVRMDVGRMSPEDSQVLSYARTVQDALSPKGGDPKTILLTELDWAVEKGSVGLNVFDQAAYLARSDLLLSRIGIKPALSIRNGDFEQTGTGLAYRSQVEAPPLREAMSTFSLKPAWWAMVRTRDLLAQMKAVDLVTVQDIVPERTQAMLFARNADGKGVTVVWRNDDPGAVTFSHTGLSVEAAEDIFGARVEARDGWYAVGKVPTVFSLAAPAADATEALQRLWVRDAGEPRLAAARYRAFHTRRRAIAGYQQSGGADASFSGRTPTGVTESAKGIGFASSGSERFTVNVPTGSGVVLAKRYFLDKSGQSGAVFVNGKPAGTWNLKRSEAALSEGMRVSYFVIDASMITGQPAAQIEIKYDAPANTLAWSVMEYAGGDFALSSIGPIHADQQIGPVRLGRSIVGGPLAVDAETFANGIGAYANCLLEYPLNRQFNRFTAKAGVDAATEGKGSVLFEVWGDGKKLWSSGITSGLDRAKAIDLDVSGVDRLRLIVNDAGDGNKFDAGDWLDPTLKR